MRKLTYLLALIVPLQLWAAGSNNVANEKWTTAVNANGQAINQAGAISIGALNPNAAAFLTIGAGSTSKGAILLTPGPLKTVPVNGLFENDSASGHIFFTTGGVRYQVDQQPISGSLPTTSVGYLGTTANRGISKTLYVSKRTDGRAGSGTAEDPLDLGSDIKTVWNATVYPSGAGAVSFAKATYTTTNYLKMPSDCIIFGNGSIIQAAPTYYVTASQQQGMFGNNDNNQSVHDLTITGFVFDSNTINQSSKFATVAAIQLFGYNIKVIGNKFINFGSRNFWGNGGIEGLENFVVGMGANWSGFAEKGSSGFEIGWNEFTDCGPNSLYTTLASMAGFLYDASYDVDKNWIHNAWIHDNYFHDLDNVSGTCTLSTGSDNATSATIPLSEGEPFWMINNGDTLPTGLAFNTQYYARNVSGGGATFQFSASQGGSVIDLTGSQSGTHKYQFIGSIQCTGTTYSKGTVIEKNRFNTVQGVCIYRDTGNVFDEIVRDNVMENVRIGIFYWPGMVYSGGVIDQRHVTVEGNVISLMAGVGALGIAIQDGASGTSTSAYTNIIVRNNKVTKYGTGNSSLGIRVMNATGVRLEGNFVADDVSDADATALQLDYTTNAMVTNNTARVFTDGGHNTNLQGALNFTAAGVSTFDNLSNTGTIPIANGGSGKTTAYEAYDAFSIHGANVASASTIDLDAATGSYVDITGTTGITAIVLSNHRHRWVRFQGVLTLTPDAHLILPGGAPITTAAGDYAEFMGYSLGFVRCVNYMRASGLPVIADATKAPLASPTFTGVPAAPTASVDTNTTQLATTAYTLGQAASATPAPNGTAAVGSSTRYARADHVHATDTLIAATDPLTVPVNTGGWVQYKVTGSDSTETGSSLADVAGLVTGTLSVSSHYTFIARIHATTSADTNGIQYGVHVSVAPTNIVAQYSGPTTVGSNLQVVSTVGTNGDNVAAPSSIAPFFTTASEDGYVEIKGAFTTASGAGPVFSIRQLKKTSGTATAKIGSKLWITKD